MLQLQQIGEAQRAGCRVMRAGERREFAVGGGEHHDIGGRLVEIDGFGRAVDHARCRGEEMHQPRSMAAMASRSMCFSPITTSSRAAALGRLPRAVEIAVEARAHGLHQKAGGRALHVGEALEAQDVMRGDRLLDALQQGGLVGDFAEADDEADEIIVVVLLLAFHLVVREAVVPCRPRPRRRRRAGRRRRSGRGGWERAACRCAPCDFSSAVTGVVLVARPADRSC